MAAKTEVLTTTEIGLDIVQAALTTTERNLLEAMLHPSATVTALIPNGTGAKELLSNLEICCRATVAMDHVKRKISPIIGRIMIVLYENPDMYRQLGYQTFPDFIQKCVYEKTGLSRSSAYECMKLVRLNPSLPIGKWAELGIDKIRILSKFTREGDPSYPKYLARANQCKTSAEFTEFAVKAKLIERGQSHMSVIAVEVRGVVKRAWNAFRADGRIHSIAGGDDDSLIFEAMIQECSSSWQIEGMVIPPDTAPLAVGVILAQCGLCKKSMDIPLPAAISLHDLRGIMHDHHRELSPQCDESVGNLIIRRSGGSESEEETG